MRHALCLFVLLTAGCVATTGGIALLPRGTAQAGSGVVNKASKQMEVVLEDGRAYRGEMVYKYVGGRGTNEASALLLGADGQLRCEFGWDGMFATATGVCVDAKGATYDMLIK